VIQPSHPYIFFQYIFFGFVLLHLLKIELNKKAMLRISFILNMAWYLLKFLVWDDGYNKGPDVAAYIQQGG